MPKYWTAIRIGLWTCIGLVYLTSVYWVGWIWEGGAYQRLNSLETRVQAIEERAGSCEVVPIP
jgi:hypothetical protein